MSGYRGLAATQLRSYKLPHNGRTASPPVIAPGSHCLHLIEVNAHSLH